jgi:hypothetical protein
MQPAGVCVGSCSSPAVCSQTPLRQNPAIPVLGQAPVEQDAQEGEHVLDCTCIKCFGCCQRSHSEPHRCHWNTNAAQPHICSLKRALMWHLKAARGPAYAQVESDLSVAAGKQDALMTRIATCGYSHHAKHSKALQMAIGRCVHLCCTALIECCSHQLRVLCRTTPSPQRCGKQSGHGRFGPVRTPGCTRGQ